MTTEKPSSDDLHGGHEGAQPFNPFLWAAVAVGILFLALALLTIFG